MSQENVEVVRGWYAAALRGDLEAAADATAPDFEFIPPDRVPDAEPVNGGAPMAAWWGRTAWSERFECSAAGSVAADDPQLRPVLLSLQDRRLQLPRQILRRECHEALLAADSFGADATRRYSQAQT